MTPLELIGFLALYAIVYTIAYLATVAIASKFIR